MKSSVGWRPRPISDLIEGVIDYRGKTPPKSPSGIPCISAANIKNGSVVLDGKFVSQETYIAWTTRGFVKPGDVLITTEAPVGEVAQLPGDQTYLITRRVIALQVDSQEADAAFLKYALREPIHLRRFASMAHGATVPRLFKEDILEYQIEIPEPPVQHKIASILSAYDDLIENNLRRIQILEEIAQALYHEWFAEFRFPGHQQVHVTEVDGVNAPEGWQRGFFTDVAEVLSGGTPKTTVPEFWNGDIPFFCPKDAPGSFYVTNTEKEVSPLGIDNCSSELYEPETVFITARGTVGKVVLPAVPMAMNQSCYALRGKPGISQLYLFLATRAGVDYLRTNTGGATFPTIIVDTFRRMPAQRPPDTLIADFTTTVRPFFGLIRVLLQKNVALRESRDTLLPRLISGELDVSDLDIEVGEAA